METSPGPTGGATTPARDGNAHLNCGPKNLTSSEKNWRTCNEIFSCLGMRSAAFPRCLCAASAQRHAKRYAEQSGTLECLSGPARTGRPFPRGGQPAFRRIRQYAQSHLAAVGQRCRSFTLRYSGWHGQYPGQSTPDRRRAAPVPAWR